MIAIELLISTIFRLKEMQMIPRRKFEFAIVSVTMAPQDLGNTVPPALTILHSGGWSSAELQSSTLHIGRAVISASASRL